MKRLLFNPATRELAATELPDNFCFPQPKSQQQKAPKALTADEVCFWHPRFGRYKARYSIYRKYDFERNMKLAQQGGIKTSVWLWGRTNAECTRQRPKG